MRKTTRSDALYAKATHYLPGGVNSPVRSFRSVGGKPFVASRGSGAELFDVDGNAYIDLVCSWGPLILGHAHSEVESAIVETLSRGSSFGVSSEIEYQLCEKVLEWVPSVQMLRLVNSGTEACMGAIRVARGATNRDLILKFDGQFHGHADSFLVAAGSGLASLGISDSAGVPKSTAANTLVAPFNDREAIQRMFKTYPGQIAGVILEVVAGNMGVIRPNFEFLTELRELCSRDGCLLIFDEVMTGFRLSRSGAQGIYPIQPDLSCFGKVIGGGLPVGAYGGRKDLMNMVAPVGPVYQSGTLSGNPLAAAAGLACLQVMEKVGDHFFQALDSRTSEWASGMRAHIETKGYPASVEQQGSMLSVFFCEEAPRNFSEAKKADLERFKTFFWSLLDQGVYYPPSQFESCFISYAHDEKIMEEVQEKSIKALDAAFNPGSPRE